MRFEKWQALGNDYLIVERDQLPVPLSARSRPAPLRPAPRRRRGRRARALAARRAGLRRAAADLQPRRLGGRAVGQRRARGDPLPAPRAAGRRATQFSIQTQAGEIRPTITSPTTCTRRHGARADPVRALPGRRAPTGAGRSRPAGATWTFQHVTIGNPQCAIEVAGVDELDDAAPRATTGPPIEHDPQFPNRTNVSWWTEIEPGFDPRADLRARGGGDDVERHRRLRAPRSPTSCAAATPRCACALDGGELEVIVEEDLHVDLSGWAVPVYAGEASDELLRTLRGLAR